MLSTDYSFRIIVSIHVRESYTLLSLDLLTLTVDSSSYS